MSPDPHVLDDLAALGRSGERRIPGSLLDKDLAWGHLVCGNEPWQQVAAERTSEQIADLIRGVVLYSRASGRPIGGSVSPVLVLYRVLNRSKTILGARANSLDCGESNEPI